MPPQAACKTPFTLSPLISVAIGPTSPQLWCATYACCFFAASSSCSRRVALSTFFDPTLTVYPSPAAVLGILLGPQCAAVVLSGQRFKCGN